MRSMPLSLRPRRSGERACLAWQTRCGRKFPILLHHSSSQLGKFPILLYRSFISTREVPNTAVSFFYLISSRDDVLYL